VAIMRKLVWVREKERLLSWPKLRARCSDCTWTGELLPSALLMAQKGKPIDKATRKASREESRREFELHRCSDFRADPA